jgi:hypothetical protein
VIGGVDWNMSHRLEYIPRSLSGMFTLWVSLAPFLAQNPLEKIYLRFLHCFVVEKPILICLEIGASNRKKEKEHANVSRFCSVLFPISKLVVFLYRKSFATFRSQGIGGGGGTGGLFFRIRGL